MTTGQDKPDAKKLATMIENSDFIDVHEIGGPTTMRAAEMVLIADALRAYAASSLAKPDFELLSKALGNTAACLGDALAIYNEISGEVVFKNAESPSVASNQLEHELCDRLIRDSNAAHIASRSVAAKPILDKDGFPVIDPATWNAAVERCATEAENTPTTLCQNGDFLSERCAKAIRSLKTAHTPAATAMPDSPTPRTDAVLPSVVYTATGEHKEVPYANREQNGFVVYCDDFDALLLRARKLERELAAEREKVTALEESRENWMRRAGVPSASALKKLPCEFCGAELTPAMLPIHTCTAATAMAEPCKIDGCQYGRLTCEKLFNAGTSSAIALTITPGGGPNLTSENAARTEATYQSLLREVLERSENSRLIEEGLHNRIERALEPTPSADAPPSGGAIECFNAAIDFALDTLGTEATDFLALWREGAWDEIAEAFPQFKGPLPSDTPSATACKDSPRWLVRAGGENYHTWLCSTRQDVRNAFSEALYGDVASAEADDIDGYMKDFDRPREDKDHDMRWSFEDGWLDVCWLAVDIGKQNV